MRRLMLLLSFVLVLVPGFLFSADGQNALEDASFHVIDGRQVLLKLTFEKPFEVGDAIRLSSSKLVFNLDGVRNVLEKKHLAFSHPLVRDISIAQGVGKTQLMVNFSTDGRYRVFNRDRVVDVLLHAPGVVVRQEIQKPVPAGQMVRVDDAATRAAVQADVDHLVEEDAVLLDLAVQEALEIGLSESAEREQVVRASEVVKEQGYPQKPELKLEVVETAALAEPEPTLLADVKFERVNKSGRLTLLISSVDYAQPKFSTAHKSLVVRFSDIKLASTLSKQLSAAAYETLVERVELREKDGVVEVAVFMNAPFAFEHEQKGERVIIDLKPLSRLAPDVRFFEDQPRFVGKPINLNFQDIEVRAVLQLIADFSKQNIVASDSVKGRITLRLKEVPWDQALNVIMKTKGLSMRRTDDIILVAPSSELRAYEKIELEASQQRIRMSPLKTEYVPIFYANAEEIAQFFKTQRNSILSTRGSIVSDSRTNAVLINDTHDKLMEIKSIIAKLDVPVRQVLIEAKIVAADETFAQNVGVNFSSSNQSDLVSSVSNDYNFSVDLLSDDRNHFASLALAQLPTNRLLALELRALESEGHGKVISSPRLITANKHTALIEQGTEIPFKSLLESSGNIPIQRTEFKKAVLSLQVTPQITPDDRIVLNLVVTQDTANSDDSFDTQKVQTQVLVNDGETIVLGGVYQETKGHSEERVPFFGELPVLGHLFRSTAERSKKTELIIFVTPKVVKSSYQGRQVSL